MEVDEGAQDVGVGHLDDFQDNRACSEEVSA